MKMPREAIAAFWKLGVALKPILNGEIDTPLTPEGEQALNEYCKLKEMMIAEIDSCQSSSSDLDGQPEDSLASRGKEEDKVKSAYNVLGQAVTELVDMYKATLNAATPEEDIKKFEDHIKSIVEALQTIGIELFAKPKI